MKMDPIREHYFQPLAPAMLFPPKRQRFSLEKCFIRTWVAIFLGLGVFPLVFLALGTNRHETCIRTTFLECRVDLAEPLIRSGFTSARLYWALTFTDDQGNTQKGWDQLDTTNLVTFADYYASYQVNETYPCSIKDPVNNQMLLRDCNLWAIVLLTVIGVIWIVTFFLVCILCIQRFKIISVN
jgi:hypothetical protein